jgi:CHAD domain-containing protein
MMAQRAPKTSRYTEVERKFDVVESTVSPSFAGLSAIGRVEQLAPQALDAVYFDTAEHDLARNRITLRRRTGGPDEGWHLKLPAGQDARTEVRGPLGPETERGTVPHDLRDVVLAIVRDKPLAPVARISTDRNVTMIYDTDGAALAEFCDDQVTASAGPETEQQWREWELELAPEAAKSTEILDRLGNRLLDAGATPAGHGSKLGRVLDAVSPAEPAAAVPDDPIHRAVAEQVAELVAWDRAVRADTYDSVHQMRVTTRKLRSLLKGSEESFGLTDDSWVLDELRQLAAILGVARDAEVLADKYQKALDNLPTELVRGPVRTRLVDGARSRYDSGLRRSLAAMRTTRYFRLLDALDAVVCAQPASTRTGAEARPVSLRGAYKRVRKAAKAAKVAAEAQSDDRDEALHRIRKGAKRLRYTAAATGAGKVADAAKAIQTLLGDHQDAVVSRTHLAQQAETAHAAGEDTFTYGLLHQQEDELARSTREDLADAMKALDKAMK